MKTFPETYMPLLQYDLHGNVVQVFGEIQPGYSFNNIVSDIMNGEYNCEKIVAIYRVEENTTTVDISDDVAKEIVSRIIRGDTPSRSAKDFINWCSLREHDEVIREFADADF
jgi:hypothetical protein